MEPLLPFRVPALERTVSVRRIRDRDGSGPKPRRAPRHRCYRVARGCARARPSPDDQAETVLMNLLRGAGRRRERDASDRGVS